MKTTAPHSMKFLKLKRRLKLPTYTVIGILEALWIFTQTNAPHGDIGRHSDEDIAVGIDWEGEPEKLVHDLVECGWLDRCEGNRLLVHDWADHCPNYIRGNIVKKGQNFAVKGERLDLTRTPKASKSDGTEDPKAVKSVGDVAPRVPPRDTPKVAPMEPPSYPILTNPILANPNQSTLPATAGDASDPKPKNPAKEPKPKIVRQPNLLFDAIAEVTGLDPATAGGQIGDTAAALAGADPPYTPDDVRQFARRFWELCSHAARNKSERPTVGEVKKYIGLLRATPPPRQATPTTAPGGQFKNARERDQDYLIDQTRNFLNPPMPDQEALT